MAKQSEEKTCPWCGASVEAEVVDSHNQFGMVKERRCPKCHGMMAAYFDDKGQVLERVRTFHGKGGE